MIVAWHVTKIFWRRGLWGRRTMVRAVDDVSLSVEPCEVFGLVGRSGCGKTTLGLILCGAMRPTEGHVALRGRDGALRAQMVFQDPRESLNPRMNVRELIAEPLRLAGVDRAERRQRVERMAEAVQLDRRLLDRYAHELSGGQRQRVAIARAVVAHPDLVVADEPTSMLDATIANEIVGLLRRLAVQERIAFVLISHDIAQVAQVCDRVGVMDSGRLVEVGPPREICLRPSSGAARELLEAARRRERALRSDATVSKSKGENV